MRRLIPTFVSIVALGMVGCTEPPKPEKATDLDKIESNDKGKGSKIELGAIPDGPIAVVGGVEIPNAKFREVYELKVKKYADRGREIPPSADRRYRKSIAERLIYHEVLKQEAQKLGVEYDAEALKEREAQQKRGIRDWDKHLERRGETEASLREMFIAELREKAILAKQGKLEVSEAEIDEDYNKVKGNWTSDKPRVRASHILVPIGPQPRPRPKPGEKAPEPSPEEKAKWEEEAKAKAESLYQQVIAEGADFTKIARENSVGPSAAKGGDIGIFTPDRMAEEFSAVAFKLKPGEISKPVKTKFGYHVIKVTGAWPPGELPKEALVDQISDRLRQRKLHKGRRELKENLLSSYDIVDNIKPTLGPEPTRKRPKARPPRGIKSPKDMPNPHGGGMAKPHGRDPHGGAHGADPHGKATIKPPEGKGDTKAIPAKAGDAKAGDAKAGNAKAGDAKAGDAKAGDAKAGG